MWRLSAVYDFLEVLVVNLSLLFKIFSYFTECMKQMISNAQKEGRWVVFPLTIVKVKAILYKGPQLPIGPFGCCKFDLGHRKLEKHWIWKMTFTILAWNSPENSFLLLFFLSSYWFLWGHEYLEHFLKLAWKIFLFHCFMCRIPGVILLRWGRKQDHPPTEVGFCTIIN